MRQFKFVTYAILLVLLLFGLVRIFVTSSGMFFNFELIGFVVLSLLSFIGLAGFTRKWGERALFFMFLLYIVNLLLIWFFFESLYLVLLLLSVFGFLMSIPRVEHDYSPVRMDPTVSEEPHSMVFDPIEPKVTHKPGKYVASKSSNVYHEPKCEWAKRIKENRRTWFAKKEDAWEKGYKAHSCVE